MPNYTIYERTDSGIEPRCKIVDGKCVGDNAEYWERMLKKLGYPEKPPNFCLYGTRLWAAEDSKDSSKK